MEDVSLLLVTTFEQRVVARVLCFDYLFAGKSTVDLVYVDFTKALDSVNHRLLLAKLTSSGLDRHVLNWIKLYHFGQSYQVQINGSLSDEATYLSGDPPMFSYWPVTFYVIYIYMICLPLSMILLSFCR